MTQTLSNRRLGWIQTGLVALVTLMPFHAFGSVWLGSLMGHQALWQSWKEVLIGLMTLVALIAAWREPVLRQRLRDRFVWLITAFIAIALLVSAVQRPGLTPTIFGIKTDIEFLVVGILAWLVADGSFVRRLERLIIITSGVVIGFGLLQIYVLPKDWLVHFGYGPTTVVAFQTLDPALSAVRILSTLGGPNQLGSFLILPLALIGWRLMLRPQWWQAIYLLAGMIVMWHTYSRSALVGLLAAGATLIVVRAPRKWQLPTLLGLTIAAALLISMVLASAGSYPRLQYYLFHETLSTTGLQASTDLHSQAIKVGLTQALHHPLGEGLGTAGSASFHSAHPFTPENYYLQIAIETGIVGLVLFVATEVLVAIRLWRRAAKVSGAAAAVATIAGIAVINLALLGWSDSSTAIIYWAFAGSVLGYQA